MPLSSSSTSDTEASPLKGLAARLVQEGLLEERQARSALEAVRESQQSMLEYVLKSPAEAKRLEIMAPPAKFELTTFHPSQDPSVADCAAPKVTCPAGASLPCPCPGPWLPS